MSTLTDAEVDYLNSQPLGRLATVGPDGRPHVTPVGVFYDPETETVVIGGAGDMPASKKFRDAQRTPDVAVVVDDLETVDPWAPRGIEVRGRAETLTQGWRGGRKAPRRGVRVQPRLDPDPPPTDPGVGSRHRLIRAIRAGCVVRDDRISGAVGCRLSADDPVLRRARLIGRDRGPARGGRAGRRRATRGASRPSRLACGHRAPSAARAAPASPASSVERMARPTPSPSPPACRALLQRSYAPSSGWPQRWQR
jgi:PPOX class F420-dependent enzyme/OxyR family protein